MARCVVSSDVGALEALGWDALACQAEYFYSRPWLAYRESTPPLGRPRYLTVMAGSRAAAALPTSIYDASIGPVQYTRADLVVARALRRAGRPDDAVGDLSEMLPMLYCGAPQIGFSHPLCDSSLPESVRAEAIEMLLDEVEQITDDNELGCAAFLYVDERRCDLRARLRRRGYAEVPSTVHSTLRAAPDFSEYLGRFRHKRRAAILREERALAAAGVELAVEPLRAELAPQLAPLISAVDAKYSGGTPVVGDPSAVAAMLVERAEHLGAGIFASIGRAGGVARGVALFYESNGWLFARDIGFDYAFQGRLPLYFAVLFYEPIRYAAARGLHGIDYGIEFEREKGSRGCELSTQYAYVKCRDPALQAHLRREAARTREEAEQPNQVGVRS